MSRPPASLPDTSFNFGERVGRRHQCRIEAIADDQACASDQPSAFTTHFHGDLFHFRTSAEGQRDRSIWRANAGALLRAYGSRVLTRFCEKGRPLSRAAPYRKATHFPADLCQ